MPGGQQTKRRTCPAFAGRLVTLCTQQAFKRKQAVADTASIRHGSFKTKETERKLPIPGGMGGTIVLLH